MAIRIKTFSNKKSYQASVRINGRRLCKNFDKKSDADKWIRSQLDSRSDGTLDRIPKITLFEFCTEWITVYQSRVRPATLSLTKHLLNAFILPTLGDCKMTHIKTADVTSLMAQLLQTGRSARYSNMVLQLIRKIFNDAISDWEYVVPNPAAKVKPFKEEPKKLEFWDADEIAKFLQSVKEKEPRHLPLFVFLMNTGCRIGEALSLHWSDVDLEQRIVCLRRTVDRISHKVQDTTKGGKLRYVGLNEACVEALLPLRPAKKNPDTLVFPNKVGGLIFHSDFQRRVFDPVIKNAAIRKIRVHDLRHTFAAHFVMNGGSIYDLKQILGHREIEMTERYAHLAPDYLKGRTSILNFR